MIRLHLAVNDVNGDVSDVCERIDVEIDGNTIMQLEGEADFLEIPGNLIQIGGVALLYDRRGTMVGNIFWNTYDVFAEDVVALLNAVKDDFGVIEGWKPLFDKWQAEEKFTVDDLNAALEATGESVQNLGDQLDAAENVASRVDGLLNAGVDPAAADN
jgi:hypothetical protein